MKQASLAQVLIGTAITLAFVYSVAYVAGKGWKKA